MASARFPVRGLRAPRLVLETCWQMFDDEPNRAVIELMTAFPSMPMRVAVDVLMGTIDNFYINNDEIHI